MFQKVSGIEKVKDKRGSEYHVFSTKLFCPTVPNHIVEEAFWVSENFAYRKTPCLRREYHDFLQTCFCLRVPKFFVREPFSVHHNRESKKMMLKRVMSRYSNEMFFPHSIEKLRRGNFLCFTKCLVSPSSTSFGYREILCLEGLLRNILTKFVSLIVPKNIVRERFCVPQNFWYRKIFSITEGGRQGGSFTISFKNIFSDSAENFCRGTLLCFRKFLVSKKVKDKRGGECQVFPSKLFCPTVPNHIVEEAFWVSEMFAYRKTPCLRREYHDFLQTCFCLRVPKFFVREPFVVSLKSGFEKTYT